MDQQERLNGHATVQDVPQRDDVGEEDDDDLPPKSGITRLKEKFLPGIKISLIITLLINLVMLIIGCYGVHKCPVNENIPLFLIASGGIGLFSKFITYIRDRILKHFQVKYIESALYTVETVFLGLGFYWVFKEYKPSYNPDDGKLYCQKTVYLFAFVYLVILVACTIAMFTGFLCFIICVYFIEKTEKKQRDNRDPESQVGRQPSAQENQQGPPVGVPPPDASHP